MSLPRFRLRTLMIAVAVAAVGITVATTGSELIARSKQYTRSAEKWEAMADDLQYPCPPMAGAEPELLAHWRSIAKTYRRAAWYPWLSVAPQSPWPK
jgi:hypothetical protein